MKDYQKLFAVRENNLTAEEIAGAETLVLFLCKGCVPALPKMNAPEYLVKAVDELLKKNEKLAESHRLFDSRFYPHRTDIEDIRTSD